MYHVVESEPGLWTVGEGYGSDWIPVADFNRQDKAVMEAERLNNPQSYHLIEMMQRQIDELVARVGKLEQEQGKP